METSNNPRHWGAHKNKTARGAFWVNCSHTQQDKNKTLTGHYNCDADVCVATHQITDLLLTLDNLKWIMQRAALAEPKAGFYKHRFQESSWYTRLFNSLFIILFSQSQWDNVEDWTCIQRNSCKEEGGVIWFSYFYIFISADIMNRLSI